VSKQLDINILNFYVDAEHMTTSFIKMIIKL